jgi:hypothetical protein
LGIRIPDPGARKLRNFGGKNVFESSVLALIIIRIELKCWIRIRIRIESIRIHNPVFFYSNFKHSYHQFLKNLAGERSSLHAAAGAPSARRRAGPGPSL